MDTYEHYIQVMCFFAFLKGMRWHVWGNKVPKSLWRLRAIFLVGAINLSDGCRIGEKVCPGMFRRTKLAGVPTGLRQKKKICSDSFVPPSLSAP